ncbi:hypothetical protein ACLPJK_25695 [Pseudomonas aeruginosa]|uniref:DUF7941 domain-family protein n=1 Tax=Pseudomonas aeruginosa TaxID=287 RepID=UPI003D27BD00
MSFYKEPITDLLDAIERSNRVKLEQTEYTYTGPEQPDAGSGRNAAIIITSKNQDSTYDGSVKVNYNRLNLSDLGYLIGGSVDTVAVDTIAQLGQWLNERFGTNFNESDLVDGPLSLSDGVPTDVTLTAASTSLAWTGQVTLNVTQRLYRLEDYLTVKRLPGLQYPELDDRKPFAAAYSYWRNCNAIKDALIAIVDAAAYDTAALASALVSLTGDQWKSAGNSRYSLEGSTFVYNGTTNGRADANDGYQNVLIIKLGDAALGLGGNLILHYDAADEFEDQE